MAVDYVIVGLGNRTDYAPELSRHNLGHVFINYLAHELQKLLPAGQSTSTPLFLRFASKQFDLLELELPGLPKAGQTTKVALVRTYCAMNESGEAVVSVLKHLGFDGQQRSIVVCSDDINWHVGYLDLQRGGVVRGGLRGHKGFESVETLLQHADFTRVRMGIGRPPEGIKVPDYVLAEFALEDYPKIGRLLDITSKVLVAAMRQEDTKNLVKRLNKAPSSYAPCPTLVFPTETLDV
jgi:PTH1 family peptidyl-tRNA hydrolase